MWTFLLGRAVLENDGEIVGHLPNLVQFRIFIRIVFTILYCECVPAMEAMLLLPRMQLHLKNLPHRLAGPLYLVNHRSSFSEDRCMSPASSLSRKRLFSRLSSCSCNCLQFGPASSYLCRDGYVGQWYLFVAHGAVVAYL